MRYAPPISRLLEELERLPGIGPKSAQRIAYWLLTADSADADRLAGAITEVKRTIHFCPVCFNFAEGDLCEVCADSERDRTKVCVVEEPRDVVALERTGEFRGTYHVLQGAISPIDGIGPERLRAASSSTGSLTARSPRSSSPPTPTSRARPRRCTSRG